MWDSLTFHIQTLVHVNIIFSHIFIVKGAPSGQIRDLLLYTVYLFHGAAHRNHLKAQLLDS